MLIYTCLQLYLCRIILPLVAYRVLYILLPNGVDNATATQDDIATFGFLLGTFPTAPTVFVFASQYSLAMEVVSVNIVNIKCMQHNILSAGCCLTCAVYIYVSTDHVCFRSYGAHHICNWKSVLSHYLWHAEGCHCGHLYLCGKYVRSARMIIHCARDLLFCLFIIIHFRCGCLYCFCWLGGIAPMLMCVWCILWWQW